MATVVKPDYWPVCISHSVVDPSLSLEESWTLVLSIFRCKGDNLLGPSIWIWGFEPMRKEIIELYGPERAAAWQVAFFSLVEKRYIVQIPSLEHQEVFAVGSSPMDDDEIAFFFGRRSGMFNDLDADGCIWWPHTYSDELLARCGIVRPYGAQDLEGADHE